MTPEVLRERLAEALASTQALREELLLTQQGLVALTIELEQRVDERTAELSAAHAELKRTNSELLQLTLQLEDRVHERTAELESARSDALGLMDEAVEVSKRLEQANATMQQEIAERKRVEEALRESEERSRVSFEKAAVGQALTSLDGRFLRVNAALATVLGAAPEELQGKSFADLTHKDDVGPSTDAMSALLTGQDAVRFEKRYVALDGRTVWVDANIALLRDAQGRPEHFIATLVDITQRKRAEAEREKLREQLLASQKMEAIGSLAGGIAHDFNNLLSVILSYGTFGLEAVSEHDPLHGDLLEIKSAAERAARLTAQLLAFGRKQVLRPEPLDLNRAVSEMEKMLRRIIGEDIELVHLPGSNLGVVKADPSQIEQVIMNLAVNARDAMPEGGKLTIETANAEIDEGYASEHIDVKPGPYVMLMVTDTGCGMDEQTRSRIFEPFFTTKGPKKGTGLGLSTVYGIVKQSGGNIWVYSEPGHGTSFKIYLPRELGAAASSSRPAPSVAPAVGTETILVVEDEPALGAVVKRILGAAGYTVLVAQSGGEALLICEGHEGEIHMVLTDVIMPQMSGKAFAECVAKTRPQVKVLYMSGYTDDAIVHHGVLDPGTRFIAKPFNAADLARKVREVLDAPASGDGEQR
jgi:PAS domain S-box-containing protein